MKILYVTTISDTVNAFLIPHIEMLVNNGHEVDVAFNLKQEISKKLIDFNCKIHEIEFSRSLFKNNYFKLIRKIKNMVLEESYDVIHTHTPIASAIIRIACKNIKDIRVIYTAHGFHFYKGAPLINKMIFYPVEKILSNYTDTIITINQEDYNQARNMYARHVKYMPGVGLDMEKFKSIEIDRASKQAGLGLPVDSFIILSVGEINKNKNHETIIRAIAKLGNPKIHYVICGEGPLEQYLRDLSVDLNAHGNVHLLGYRNDIAELCKMSDVFAFPSLREGLGMAALEAMACGLPLLTSNKHGIKDYSIDSRTGFTYNPLDINGFAEGILYLYNNPLERKKFSLYNSEAVKEYSLSTVLDGLLKVY